MHAFGIVVLWLAANALAPTKPAPPSTAPSEPVAPVEAAPTQPVAPTGPTVAEPTPPAEPPVVPTEPTPPLLPPVPGEVEPPGDPTAPVPTKPRTDATAGDGPLAIALEWNAPTTCPGSDRVRTVVAALLDREVELDETATVVVRGDIAPIGNRWLLQLAVEHDGAIEQRRLEADRCETLADAAALIVATGIDPRRVAKTLAERPEPQRGQDPRDRSPAPAEPEKLRVALGVASGPALGLVPKVAAWLQGDVALHIRRARVGVQVGHAFERKTGGDPGATVRNTAGTLRGCFAPTQRKISLPVCGLFEAGSLSARASGTGVSGSRQRALWLAMGLGAAIEYAPIPRLALVAGVDALVALRRARFHVQTPTGRDEVFRVAPAGVRLVLGLSVRLP